MFATLGVAGRDGITVGVYLASDGVRLAAVQLLEGVACVTVTFSYRSPGGSWAAGEIPRACVVREGLRQAFADIAPGRTLAVLRASPTDLAVQIPRGDECAFGRATPVASEAEEIQTMLRTLDFSRTAGARDKVERLLVAGPNTPQCCEPGRADSSLCIEGLLPGRIACVQDVGELHAYATAIGLALPGPAMNTVGVPPRSPGLFSKLVGMFRRG